MSGGQGTGWIAWFALNPVAANLLMATILVMGLATGLNMRTEGFPASDPRTVTVTVAFDGASPDDVEEGAAIKVEQALSGVVGIKKITSTVTASEAVVSVQSIDGHPLNQLKDDIEARVNAITTFPAQVERTTVTAEQEDRHVINVQVTGAVDHRTLKETARRIRQDLLSLPTISKVITEGALGYEITVELSEDKLRAFRLSFDEVAQAIQGRSVNLSAGQLKTERGTFSLQSRNQAYYGAELERTVIRSSPQGGVVRLGDVARVVDGFAEDPLISMFNGQPSIKLDVQLTGKDSITAASDSVTAHIESLQSTGALPQGIEVSTWSDEATEIRDRLALMSRNALIGMGLVFAMLALFLNIRVALWVAVGIPISFAGTLYVLGPVGFDYSLNDLTTFGFIIVLGIVVDDAIVIGENIFTHKQTGGDGVAAAINGAQEVATPATFGVLTTVAAFLPLTMISGDFGGPFKIIAIVVIVCLLFSLVESKLILPSHLAHVTLTEQRPTGWVARGWTGLQNRIEAGLNFVIERIYKPILHIAVSNLLASVLLSLAVLTTALGLVTRGVVPTQFFPERDSSTVYVTATLDSGAPVATTRAVAEMIEASLVQTGALFQDRHGLAQNPIQNRYVSSSKTDEVTLTVQLPNSAGRSFSAADFIAGWRAATGGHPAIKQVNYFTDDEDFDDLRIELTNADADRNVEAMKQVVDALRGLGGVHDIRTNLDDSVTELTFEILPLGERLGVTNLSLITQLRNSVYGFEAQKIQRGEDEVSLRVRVPRDARDTRADLDRVRVATASGGSVPVTSVASVTARETQAEFERIDGRRVLTLTARIDEEVTSSQAVLAHLETGVFSDLKATVPGQVLTIAGEAEQESEATGQLIAGFALAVMLIYALLAIPLRSYLDPLVIMCAIPFGIVGAILGHWIIGIPISLLSFFGILALSGVVVNDALVLTSRYRAKRDEGEDYVTAILHAGPSRFRAILLTSVTTFAGLAPLVWETSEQAQILIPMAVSLAFGLLFATMITLLIVPVMLGVRERFVPARTIQPATKLAR
ncbi:efflux RND transporter permease subunit [Tropicibacter sp. R16_0]|uniref:efflux RND transporter permease subunit n=1 Tax=Tropicibacter sp. R16_0 TaxID=2821102 RepID=UPI001ADA8CF8|nr:efflux RND transporter permease subunit [Tropicibacter sp. R16_0]MBO9451297.1 efflux RND transporter permease subunit [Tropicibacter sp. R16_0]